MLNNLMSEDVRALDAIRLKNLKEQRDALEEEIDEKKIELQKVNNHIEALQVLQGEEDKIKPKPDNTAAEGHPISSTTAPLEIAHQILKERKGADIHYTELAEEVVKRGGELRDGSANLLNTLLTSDRRKRFVRPYRRGRYALKEDHPDLERSVGERHPKKMH